MANKSVTLSIGTILILAGALLGIIAVFLVWLNVTIDLWITTASTTYTGMDFFTGKFDTNDFQRYCPFIAWILAILVLVINFLPVAGVKIDSKVRNTASVIFGVLIICFVVIWGTYHIIDGVDKIMFDNADIGAWLMIASGAVITVGSCVNFFTKD